MAKIGVIGDATSILGFKAFGLDVFACNTAEEAAAKLHQIAKEGYGIIYITERFCQELQEEMDRYVSERTPAIIPIPGVDGNFGHRHCQCEEVRGTAVGADILFGGDR